MTLGSNYQHQFLSLDDTKKLDKRRKCERRSLMGLEARRLFLSEVRTIVLGHLVHIFLIQNSKCLVRTVCIWYII